jgi:hypothetical protein
MVDDAERPRPQRSASPSWIGEPGLAHTLLGAHALIYAG